MQYVIKNTVDVVVTISDTTFIPSIVQSMLTTHVLLILKNGVLIFHGHVSCQNIGHSNFMSPFLEYEYMTHCSLNKMYM